MRTHSRRLLRPGLAIAFAIAAAAFASPNAQSQTFSVVHTFTGGADGGNPQAGLVAGTEGNFYGTASSGGQYGAGDVYEMSSTGTVTVLYSFTGAADGSAPTAALLFLDGALYGTTSAGGAYGAGTVFEVTLAGKETVLYSFTGGADGSAPGAGLAHDASTNLYGTTFAGGTGGNGTVFELLHPKNGTTPWPELVLYSFGAVGDGTNPVSGVALDKAGNLYGTTSVGGTGGYGNVYQLVPSSSTPWTENILHQFQLLTDGGTPYAGIVLDHAGNLYGATTDGGQDGQDGGGTIFKMSNVDGAWTFTVLYGLEGWGISGSFRNILVASPTLIYATTHCDGANNDGTVFELKETKGVWGYTVLYTFTGGSDGYYLFSSPVLDHKGSLYGTTRYGGTGSAGVLFKIKLP